MSDADKVRAVADEAGLNVIVEPVTMQEVAELLGVRYEKFRMQMARNSPAVAGFPKPRVVYGVSKVWELDTVLEWVARRELYGAAS